MLHLTKDTNGNLQVTSAYSAFLKARSTCSAIPLSPRAFHMIQSFRASTFLPHCTVLSPTSKFVLRHENNYYFLWYWGLVIWLISLLIMLFSIGFLIYYSHKHFYENMQENKLWRKKLPSMRTIKNNGFWGLNALSLV